MQERKSDLRVYLWLLRKANIQVLAETFNASKFVSCCCSSYVDFYTISFFLVLSLKKKNGLKLNLPCGNLEVEIRRRSEESKVRNNCGRRVLNSGGI